MPATHLLMTGFREIATPQTRFSNIPCLTIQQAYHQAAEFMPGGSCVVFHRWGDITSIDTYPFSTPEQALADNGPEPSHFSYKFYPAHKSALISRMRAHTQKSGIGSAMIAAQYPFLQRMGVEVLSVSTHAVGEGFYRKLGFRNVDRLPEKPQEDPRYSTLMRLDLTDPEQKSVFEAALSKAPALTTLALRL